MPYKDSIKQKKAQRRHYLKNKKEYAARLVARRKRNRAFVKQYKEDKSCTKCGESNPLCFHFHHPNNDKDASINHGMCNWGLDRLKKELEKCDVLCGNCHRILHYKEREISVSNTPLKIKRNRNRKFILEHKQIHDCQECGESHPGCLDYHHASEKTIGINRAICDWGLPRLKKEIEKCTLLCCNCHQRKHSRKDRI